MLKAYCVYYINQICFMSLPDMSMDGHLCKHIAFLPAFCRLVSPHRKEVSDALSLLQTSLILGSLPNEDTHGLPRIQSDMTSNLKPLHFIVSSGHVNFQRVLQKK